MRASLTPLLVGALLLAAGCEAPFGETGEAAEETAAVSPEAAPHEDARFLVRGGDEVYRVNVRYVDMIEESVIAVRQGRGDAGDWPAIVLADPPRAPSALPFEAGAWRPVALEVADSVRQRRDLCSDGREMRLARADDGDVRLMYRKNHEAWVVFAACAAPQAG